jgi:HlyD family secretion protein
VSALGLWLLRSRTSRGPESVQSNGRIEATEVDLATKLAGRVLEVPVREGDSVLAGTVVARLDARTLEAEVRQAEADVARVRAARSSAAALVAQREVESSLAARDLQRAEQLFQRRVVPEQQVDRQRTAARTATTAWNAAVAEERAMDAALSSALARRDRLRTDLEDAVVRAPSAGQVLYRLAEPGEVLPAGGPVATLIDLDDVYMTIFLPAAEAGRVRVGTAALLVLDALPRQPVPAQVTFIAPEAQFTPRQVETRAERAKLVFRVKVRALDNRARLLRPGMTGIAVLRGDGAEPWPPPLP